MIRWLGLTLVGLQLLGSALLVVTGARAMFSAWTVWGGIALCGVGLHGWAMVAMGPGRVQMSPTTPRHGELVSAGPYRWIRHPMYTALLVFSGAFLCAEYTVWKVGIWVALLLALVGKAWLEERALVRDLPGYSGYVRTTWRFVPFVW